MKNHAVVMQGLKDAYSNVKVSKGTGVGIVGPSGIGKTYVVNSFLAEIEQEVLLISVKGLPIAQSAYSAIYQGIFDAISTSEVKKGLLLQLLKKYSRLLPGFGKCISPLLDNNTREAMANLLSKSSLPVGVSPAPHIVRFLNELAGKKHCVLFCDDAQWIDPETWSCLVFIAESLLTINWLIILIFNDRIETWTTPNNERLTVIERWKIRSNELKWTISKAEAWSMRSLPLLCEKILKKRIQVSDENIEILYQLSSGLPLYLKSILDYLLDNNYLILKQNVYEQTGNWSSLDLGKEIHDSIIYQLERVYREVPKSRQYLEVASVLGEPFLDEGIDDILELCDSFQLLSEVEKKSPLIQYIFQKRHWIFQHNQVRAVIYKSLGPTISKKLHKKVGQYLESSYPNHHLTIANHFEIAGDIEKELLNLHSEIRNLLGQSLFNSALMISERVMEKVTSNLLLLDEKLYTISVVLHGRCFFHLGAFREAINEFGRVLNEADSKHTLASLHRWLGRCYMKLDSQDDFQISLEHLTKSLTLFGELGSIREIAITNADLVVTYAHLNLFDRSEEAFFKAEKGFNQTRDRVGMAMLQRKSVIFMESEVSAPILEKRLLLFNILIYHMKG